MRCHSHRKLYYSLVFRLLCICLTRGLFFFVCFYLQDVSLLSGVLILRDNKPDEPEEIVEFKEPGAFGEVEEAPMPEPFEWEP